MGRVSFDGSLRDYFAASSEVETRSLALADDALEFLSSIHQWFAWFLDDVSDLHPSVGLLTFNAIIHFDAAAKLAVSGQAHAVFPVLRTSLESVCYAHALATRPELIDIWVNRGRSPADLAACRRSMSGAVGATARALNAAQDRTGECVKELYEASIDWGAHPNVQSIMGNTLRGDDEADIQARLIAVHSPRGQATVRAKAACIDLGVTLAIVMSHLKKDRKADYLQTLNKLIEDRAAVFEGMLDDHG